MLLLLCKQCVLPGSIKQFPDLFNVLVVPFLSTPNQIQRRVNIHDLHKGLAMTG
jgi:hypothetical protein